MTNYREIIRLDGLGLNKSQITSATGYSRTTVIQVLKEATAKNLQYPLPEDMSDKDLAAALFPPAKSAPKFKIPDYAYVYREMNSNKHISLTQLWLEYVEECRANGETPYQSTQFNKYYNDYLAKTNATMHLNHKPGEKMQVDWAGDTAHIIDTDTGEFIKAYVFVSVLPYSGYAYVEAFLNMELESWIAAHVNSFRYFQGIPKIIECDNLKTGVIKHGKDEIELNRTYREMAEYYNTAIIPARVRAPKDKAAVERTVGIISTYILTALRNRQFLTLAELNEAIWERLYTFNNKPFQKRDGSRLTEYEEEKAYLMPLPKVPFELATWKKATVGPNYHISVDKMYYSVPYEYIKQTVDVRITNRTVEVFFGENRICSHARLFGKANQYSTVEAHMPPKHQMYVQWNAERFINWAAKIGTNCQTVIKAILESYKVEQQGYNACLGLMKLADKYSVDRLEKACEKILYYTTQPSLKQVRTILESGQDKITVKEKNNRDESEEYGFSRGAEYYAGRSK